jgi:hypothetical protein
MPGKFLFTIGFKITFAIIDDDSVIHRLPCEVFAVRVHSSCRNGVHIRLTYVLRNNRNTKLPNVDLFIVCC